MFTENGGQKRSWGYIKSKKTENSGVAPLKDERGITVSSSEGKSEIVKRQFTSVFGPKDSLPMPNIKWSFPPMQQTFPQTELKSS
jgi:hypothetical protein